MKPNLETVAQGLEEEGRDKICVTPNSCFSFSKTGITVTHYHAQIPFHLHLLKGAHGQEAQKWPCSTTLRNIVEKGTAFQIPAWVSAATCWARGRTPALEKHCVPGVQLDRH